MRRCRLLLPTRARPLSMEDDADTRKISGSFLRDHSYATEGGSRARSRAGGRGRGRAGRRGTRPGRRTRGAPGPARPPVRPSVRLPGRRRLPGRGSRPPGPLSGPPNLRGAAPGRSPSLASACLAQIGTRTPHVGEREAARGGKRGAAWRSVA